MKQRKLLFLTTATLTAALGLTGCAGGVGSNTAGDDSGAGLPAGATDQQYQEALADLPETTLVYQPTAASPEAISAPRALAFKERVEEASGGKITIDLVWGQAVAGYSELDAALVDGRVDLAVTLPIYNPSEYPVNDAFVSASTLAPTSPREGDLASNAAMLDLAWNSEQLMEEFESKGLHPLMPFHPDGPTLAMCTEPVDSPDDWKGRQVRVSSAIQAQQMEELGATVVSLEFPELYEALERGTIDCALGHGAMATGVGFVDLVPYAYYPENSSFAPGALSIMGGSDYAALPLAARQLVFDSLVATIEQQHVTSLEGSANVASTAREKGGTVVPLDERSSQTLKAQAEQMVAASVEKGTLPEDFAQTVQSSVEEWRGIVTELGLQDEGQFATLDQWHDPSAADLGAYAQRVYDEVMAEHRPE